MISNCFGNYLLYPGPCAKGNLSSSSGWITGTGEAWVIAGAVHPASQKCSNSSGIHHVRHRSFREVWGEDAICSERLMGRGFMSFCNFGSTTITKTLMSISLALMASDALMEHIWEGRRLTLKGEVPGTQEAPGQKAGRHLN